MSAPRTDIIFTVGNRVSAQYTVEPGEYLIGQDADCRLRVAADGVSSHHAKLIVRDSFLEIEDLRSTNGTLVDGQLISGRVTIHGRQKIQLGDATLEVHFGSTLENMQETEVSTMTGTHMVPREKLPLPQEFFDKKYRIGSMVARGGMGAILAAREGTIARKVAMKVMLDGANGDHLTRFITEAKITGQLEHPSIVPIYELGTDEQDRVFYTMKFVHGTTMREVLEKQAKGDAEMLRKYPLSALLTIYQKACDAMAFAHNRGIIHRDLKPEHIMIGEYGEVLVMDWGLAKRFRRAPDTVGGTKPLTEEDPQPLEHSFQEPGGLLPSPELSAPADEFRTLVGTIMGTPQYMAPEQARGEVDRLDSRSDIYALGAVLFHLLHLQPYVSGPTAFAIVEKVKNGGIPWPAPKKIRPIPESLMAVCRQALHFDPEQRYQSVEDLQRDITAYQNGFATQAEKAGAWKHFALLVKRNVAATIGIAAVLIVGGVFGTKALVEGRRAEQALADLKKSAPTLLALADSEAGFQRFDSALEKLDAALSLDDSLLPAYWDRVWILIGKEKWGRAISAARIAEEKDPAHRDFAGVEPILKSLEGMASDKERYESAAMQDLIRYLAQAGATSTQLHFVNRINMGQQDRIRLTQHQVDTWLGAGKVKVRANGERWIEVDLSNQPVDTLDPLRNLPIESLIISNHGKITSLEAVRGMPLHKLHCSSTAISDLSPLKGMPLEWLNISYLSKVTDLSPLQGMPIKSLEAAKIGTSDFKPLVGMPLEFLYVTSVADLSALTGIKLNHFKADHAPSPLDLRFLRDAPIDELELDENKIETLEPLRGKPIRILYLQRNNVVDLSPLRQSPLAELDVRRNPRLRDFSPLLETPQLTHLKFSKAQLPGLGVLRPCKNITHFACDEERYMSYEQFWASYDEQVEKEKAKAQ